MDRPATIEHDHGRLGSILRARRLRLVLWIVVIEGVLLLTDVIPWWTAFVLAAAAFAAYVGAGRQSSSSLVREASWIAAVSQLAVVLVPVLALVLTTLAVIVLVLVAVAALTLILLDRR
jgi:hypothetical protein